jgi:hypothetical protein
LQVICRPPGGLHVRNRPEDEAAAAGRTKGDRR